MAQFPLQKREKPSETRTGWGLGAVQQPQRAVVA